MHSRSRVLMHKWNGAAGTWPGREWDGAPGLGCKSQWRCNTGMPQLPGRTAWTHSGRAGGDTQGGLDYHRVGTSLFGLVKGNTALKCNTEQWCFQVELAGSFSHPRGYWVSSAFPFCILWGCPDSSVTSAPACALFCSWILAQRSWIITQTPTAKNSKWTLSLFL